MSVFERLKSGSSSSGGGVFSRIQAADEERRRESTRRFNEQVPFDYRQTPLFQAAQDSTAQRQSQSRQALSQIPMDSRAITERVGQRAQTNINIPTIGPYTGGITEEKVRSGTSGLPKDVNKDLRRQMNQSNIPIADRIMQGASDFTIRAINSAALGIPLATIPGGRQAFEDTQSTAGTVGSIGGLFVPGAAAYNTVGRAAGRALSRLAPNAGRVAQSATRGGGAGLGFGLATESTDALFDTRHDGSNTVGERLRNVGIETALGAGGDALLTAASPMVRRAFDYLIRRNAPPTPQAQPTLGLPEPRQRGNVNTAQTPDVINVPETEPRALPPSARYEAAQSIRESVREPLALPESERYRRAMERSRNAPNTEPIRSQVTPELPEASPEMQLRYRNIEEGRRDLGEINRSIHEMETRYQQAINEQYQYLKSTRDLDRGDAQRGLIRDQVGEVTDRFSISGKPAWQQEFFRETGKRRPNNKELYELAKKHVDEGFIDDGGQIPSWRAQNNFDETMSALTTVRDQVQNSLRELDPAITFTDSELIGQNQRYTGDRRPVERRELPRRTESPQIDVEAARRQMERFNELVRADRMTRPLVGRASAPQTTPQVRGGVFNRVRQQAETVQEAPRQETPRQETVRSREKSEMPREQQTVPETESITTPKNTRVRDRIVDRLDELERQARERIAAQRNRISSNPIDIYRDYAIIGAAKMGKGIVKFADWSEDMVREFGEELRPRLRQIYEQSREMYQRTTKEAQEALEFAESGTGDAATFREKVARGKETRSRSSFMEFSDKMRTQIIDDVAPLERLEKNIRGKVSSAEESLYKTARLFKGVPAKAQEIVRTRLGPIIDQVEKAGFKPDDLGDYALAVHSRDVNRKGLMSGFTNKEIEQVVQKYSRLEEARKALVQLGNDMLEDLADAQVISRDLYDTLRERYPNYVPLFRHFDDEKVEFGQGLTQAMANVGNPMQRLKGSKRKVVDPLENMVSNIFRSINSAERNRVALQLAKLADEDIESQFIRRLEPYEEVGRKNVVTVRMEGQPVRFEVQPEVYKAILGLDQDSAGVIVNLLSKPASLLRAGATLTPEFSLRNPMRDVVQAYVVSNSGFNPITDFPIALFETITKGQGIRIGNRRLGGSDLYSQFLKDNAGYGNLISMDRKVHRESLERVLKQPASKKFVNVVSGRSILNVLRAISDTTETATKLGEYRAALRKGQSRSEAAYRARDIMDFARSGSKTRNINKMVAFFNANLQGKSKIIRAIKENPIGVTARGIKLVTLPTIGVFFAQKYLSNDVQETTIKDAPRWMKNSFWLVPIPGTDQVARIPKPFDIAPIFANGPERALEYIYENDQQAFDNYVKDSLESMAVPVMLTGLLPLVEGAANYSFFRDSPIIPQREQNLEYRDQYDLDTPVTARAIARGVEAVTGGEGVSGRFSSPRVVDHVMQGLTAGLGGYANSAIDFFVKDLAGGEISRPSRDVSQAPLARAFLVNQGGSGKSMNDLYELREKLTRERGSANLRNETFANEAQYKFINTLTSEISNINKLIREIESSDRYSSQQKGDAIKKLNQRRNDIARRGMQRYREVFEGR